MNKKSKAISNIDQMRNRLWMEHLAVMVGAGFSLNAKRKDKSRSLPPDWQGLSKALANRLYPDEQAVNVASRKTPLELGEEFSAKFGRDALDSFLREQVDDENLLPGELHGEFFKLPWTEVFTTNYDTLLEKATENVLKRRFQVIHTAEDLLESESPRIVKLHGSVDCDTRPLVFTEEDYRTYDTKGENEPFVNLVRQTLTEDCLCLIGFSGKDPNFRKWEGWLRDHYKFDGEHPRIFLVGARDVSGPESIAFAKRGICLVNLSDCFEDCNGDIQKELHHLFEFLGHDITNASWKAGYWNVWDEKTPEEKVCECIENLRREFRNNPNQLVLPDEQFWRCVEASNRFSTGAFVRLLNMPSPWDLKGLHVLVRRFDQCLSPLFSDKRMIEAYEEIMRRYSKALSNYHFENDEHHEFRRWYEELVFAHLRWSRQYCDVDRWNYDCAVIDKTINRQSPWDTNDYIFERIQQAFALPDVKMLDRLVSEWRGMYRMGKYNVKFASVLLELGHAEEAVDLLKKTLAEIRQKIPRGKFKGDVELLSVEGSALIALNMAEADGEVKSENYERLKQLAAYGCNPWIELNYLDALLSAPMRKRSDFSLECDLDQSSSCVFTEYVWPEEPLHAFQLFRYFEEMGLPVFTPTSTLIAKGLQGAVARAASYAPGWAFGMFIRSGKGRDVSLKTFFGFEALRKMTAKQVDGLVSNYVAQVSYMLDEHLDALLDKRENYYCKLAPILIEVLSRLCYRAGGRALESVFDLGIRIYSLDVKKRGALFSGLGRYFSRLLEAMSPRRIFERLDELLVIDIPRVYNENYDWQNPLRVDWRGFKCNGEEVSDELKKLMAKLVEMADTDDVRFRSEVMVYWRVCLELGAVSNKFRAQMSEVIARHCAPNGYFADNHLYRVALKGIVDQCCIPFDVDATLRDFYKSYHFPLFTKEEDSEHSWLGWNGDPTANFANSILLSSSVFINSKTYRVELDSCECNIVLSNFLERWQKDSKRVLEILRTKDPLHCQEQMRIRVHNYDMVLSDVVLPLVKEGSARKAFEELAANEFFADAFPASCVEIGVSCGRAADVFTRLHKLLLQAKGRHFNQICDAVYLACRHSVKFRTPQPPTDLLHTLVNVIALGGPDEFKSASRIISALCRDNLLPLSLVGPIDGLLGQLLNTMSDGDGERFEDGTRLFVYLSAARLAAEVHELVKRLNIQELLPGVHSWKSYCESTEAFSCYRNAWTAVVEKKQAENREE